jgi:ATP-dependent DNA helicase RecG
MIISELIPGFDIEDCRTEFKGLIEEGNKKEMGWLKTLAAFANTEGGQMFIGVEDKSHTVVALDSRLVDKTVLMVQKLAREKIKPALDFKIDTVPLPDCSPKRYVIRIAVQKSRFLPVAVHEDGLLGIYVRNFGRTEIASPEQIRDLVLLSDSNPFDESMTEELYNQPDFSVLRSLYKERTGTELTDKALVSKGFMDSDCHLSRGALLFRDDCSDKRTRIVATMWPETSKGSSIVLASETFDGNIIGGIGFAIGFISNHSANGFRKEAAGRNDYYSYPARSVTEGVVNAVAHRNYFISGSQIEVNLFKDRLEITSPGALLGVRVLQKEYDIASIIPQRRNEVICGILEICRYMESNGSGFDKIAADYQGKGENYQPYVSSDASSFTLTLPNLVFNGGVIGEGSIPYVYVDAILPGRNDLRIVSFCFASGKTVRQIADYLGIKPSTYFRKHVLDTLSSDGYLIKDASSDPVRYQSNPSMVHVSGN